MDKAEFLAEVGRMADRLFPEPLLVVRSRDWWKAEMQKDKLSSERLESNREVIQHWIDGGDVWCEGTLVSSQTPCFEAPRRTFSLTDPSLPEPEPETGRQYWARLLKDGLPSNVTASREVIEAWVRGETVWVGCAAIGPSIARPMFTDPDTVYSLTDPSLPKPKKYRPWTWADRGLVPDSVGYVESPAHPRRPVEGVTRDGLVLGDGLGPRSWSSLHRDYAQPDGSPCGVEVSE